MGMHEAVEADPDGGQLLLVWTGAGSWLREWRPWRFCCFLFGSFANELCFSLFTFHHLLLCYYSIFGLFVLEIFSHGAYFKTISQRRIHKSSNKRERDSVMSNNAQNGNFRNGNSDNASPSHRSQSTSIFRTPRKHQRQAAIDAEDAQPEPSHIGSTATGPATPTPHRYGLRARRASRGSFSTPSRCGRTASRQTLQQTLQQRNNGNGGGAAAIRIGFQLDFGVLSQKADFRRRIGIGSILTAAATNNIYVHAHANSHNHNHSHSSGNTQFAMASGGKWREEQVLVICPGSRTTMAQLGCGELSPPHHRIPTRMFRDEENPNLWRPYYTYKRVTTIDGVENEEWVEDVDEDKDAVWPIEGMFLFVFRI